MSFNKTTAKLHGLRVNVATARLLKGGRLTLPVALYEQRGVVFAVFEDPLTGKELFRRIPGDLLEGIQKRIMEEK